MKGGGTMRMARTCALAATLALAGGVAGAGAAPHTTVERTILDCDGDNLLESTPGEEHVDPTQPVPGDDECEPDRGDRRLRLPATSSIINFLQLSDFQMVDEESPGRVEFFDGTQRGPFNPFSAAYRPQESLTTQVTEAMVRQARNTTSPVTGVPLELSILTGDNADSQQHNETRWFIDILDGTAGQGNPDPEMDPSPNTPERKVDPNSGIPQPGCEATPGSKYDGVRAGGIPGPDPGYYEPDHSFGASPEREDGDGYSPDRNRNRAETPFRDVTVRDFPGFFEAANEPFEAVGLGMPWYSAFGNHDALVQGNDANAYFGPGGPFNPTPGAAEETSNPLWQAIVTGCVKPANATAFAGLAPFFMQLEELFEQPGEPDPGDVAVIVEAAREYLEGQVGAGNAFVVPPDPRRCFLAKDEPNPQSAPAPCNTGSWIQQHFRSTGTPSGHGFTNRPLEARQNNDGYYSFSPEEHLRFIVLDSVTDECGVEFCSEGSIDDTQFQWLDTELKRAAMSSEYVLVFGHHTLATMRQPTNDVTEAPIHYGQRLDRESPTNPQNVSIGRSLEELLCDHPNVLAYVNGHEHANEVNHRECNEDQPPTLGPGDFWEVSTAAHIDWSQQARMIELVQDGLEMKMVLTILDHAGPAYPGGPQPLCPSRERSQSEFDCGRVGDQVARLASIGREIAYNDYQGGRFTGGRGDRDDRNLIVALGRPFPCDEEPPDEGDPPGEGECAPGSAND